MIIAGGLRPGILEDLFQGKDVGPFLFPSRENDLQKVWIAFTLKQKGVIKVDRNAERPSAIRERAPAHRDHRCGWGFWRRGDGELC